MDTDSAKSTGQDDAVHITWTDRYDDVLGPPGGRGLPDTGHRQEPADHNPVASADLSRKIWDEAVKRGITPTTREERHKPPVQISRYDFASITEIVKSAAVATTGGVAISILRSIQPHLAQWLKNRAGRTVTIKTRDYEITAKGDLDIENALRELGRQYPKSEKQK